MIPSISLTNYFYFHFPEWFAVSVHNRVQKVNCNVSWNKKTFPKDWKMCKILEDSCCGEYEQGNLGVSNSLIFKIMLSYYTIVIKRKR